MKKEKMNKASVVVIAIAFILGLVIGYAISNTNEAPEKTRQFQTGENILQNSGFESEIEGEPANWFKAYIPEDDITMAWDDETTYSESKSASIHKISNTDINNELVNNNWAQDIHIIPIGRDIELSGYIKTVDVGDDSVVMVIQCWDENFNIVGFATTQGIYNISGTTDWTQYITSLKVPEETHQITIRLVLVGTGQVWFDDVALVIK